MSDATPDLKIYGLFSELSHEDRDAVAELLEPKKVAKGRRLFREGGPSEGLVLLASGTIEIESSRTEHRAVLGSGSALGALSLMVVGAHEVGARTLEPVELWVLPRERFRRLVDDHPRTACRLCEAIAAELAGDVREALDGLREG